VGGLQTGPPTTRAFQKNNKRARLACSVRLLILRVGIFLALEVFRGVSVNSEPDLLRKPSLIEFFYETGFSVILNLFLPRGDSIK